MPNDAPAAATSDRPRSLEVFVSSTFRDMHAERNVLIRRVFPACRLRAERSGIDVWEIDLRWGITRDEAESHQTLPLCLDAIDRSRPHFIAILGQRYGFVDPGAANTLAAMRSDLVAYAGCSITELEIRHALLAPPSWAPPMRPLILCRDPVLSERLCREQGQDPADYTADAGERGRIDALAAELEARYPAMVVRYHSLDELADRVAAYLDHAIHDSIGHSRGLAAPAPAGAPEPVLPAVPEHVFGRRKEGKSLLRILRPGRRVVLCGARGLGTSTLLAQWIADARRPGFLRPALKMLYRDCEGPDRAAGWWDLVRDLVQACDGGGVDPLAPETSLTAALHRWSGGQPMALVLDNVEGLFTDGADVGLEWLPAAPPANLLLCVSVSTPSVATRLADQGWRLWQTPPVPARDRAGCAAAILGRYRKRLSPAQLAILAHSRFATVPGAVVMAVARLHQRASFETLDARLQEMAPLPDLEALVGRALEDVVEEVDGGIGTLPLRMLGALAASRFGLSETELRRAIDGPPPSPLDWEAARALIRPLTEERRRLIGFRDLSVRDRALDVLRMRDLAVPRARLAALFLDRPLFRRAEERPWHLVLLTDWEALVRELSTPQVFAALWQRSPAELGGYCERLLGARPDLPVEAILPGAEAAMRAGAGEGRLWLLARFANRDVLERNARALLADAGNPTMRRVAAVILARTALVDGRPQDAVAALKQAQTHGVIGVDEGRIPVLYLLSEALNALDRPREAFEALTAIESLARRTGDERALCLALGGQGRLHAQIRDWKGAARLFERQAVLARRTGDPAALRSACEGLSRCAWERGNAVAALKRLSEAEEYAAMAGSPEDLAALCATRADRLLALGDADGALDAIRQQRQAAAKARGPGPAVSCLLKEAELFLRIGKPGAARPLILEALAGAVAARLAGHTAVARDLLAELDQR